MPSYKVVRILFACYIVGLIAMHQFYTVHWMYYFIPSVLFLSYTLWGVLYPSSNVFIPTHTSKQQVDKNIAITFDDGPSLATIPVLDLLKRYNVKATFFCIGNHIEQYPEIFQRMVAEGHEIGNHSYNHAHIFPMSSVKTVVAEITKTNQLIEAVTGKPCRLFRPPFGVMNPSLAKAIRKCNMEVIGWNLRSFDTVIKDRDQLMNRIVERIKPGTVLLLHDNRSETGTVLDDLLNYTTTKGFHHTNVSTFFNLNANG
tara:strand:- start:1308 stop:2078 length:771 start_codon:yes stop_codon:yes gene_type:complete